MRVPFLNLLLLASPAFAAPVFIGTNTGGNSGSKGIYLADFDSATGTFTEPVLAAEYKNPGFLALHPSKPVLYASGQSTAGFADKTDSIAAFSISADHKLTFLGEASSGGNGACHVAVDATGSTAAIANYGDGSFSTIKLDEKGVPGAIATLVKSTGSGPSPRQKGPHAHGVYFDKANKFFFLPDLGLDKVLVYSFDAGTSVITESAPLATAPGAGPRHPAFSPDEKHAYVINELDNTILAASYDGKGGLKPIETVPTLPADFTTQSTTAEIEVHANGKFVYGSNRGHDSIVVFARDPGTGKLTFVQHAPCGGKGPRHFKIDPSGKWLLVGHQGSNTVSVLPLDPEKGTLGEPKSTIPAPSPICLLFAK